MSQLVYFANSKTHVVDDNVAFLNAGIRFVAVHAIKAMK